MLRPKIDISTDKNKLDILYIHQILSKTYWASWRTYEEVKLSIENSICYGVYLEGKQIGFARVLTDKVAFLYLMDVFIDPSYRGKGYGKVLVNTIFEAPEYQNIGKWFLGTKDAHSLYEKIGFRALEMPERFMEKQNR